MGTNEHSPGGGLGEDRTLDGPLNEENKMSFEDHLHKWRFEDSEVDKINLARESLQDTMLYLFDKMSSLENDIIQMKSNIQILVTRGDLR